MWPTKPKIPILSLYRKSLPTRALHIWSTCLWTWVPLTNIFVSPTKLCSKALFQKRQGSEGGTVPTSGPGHSEASPAAGVPLPLLLQATGRGTTPQSSCYTSIPIRLTPWGPDHVPPAPGKRPCLGTHCARGPNGRLSPLPAPAGLAGQSLPGRGSPIAKARLSQTTPCFRKAAAWLF